MDEIEELSATDNQIEDLNNEKKERKEELTDEDIDYICEHPEEFDEEIIKDVRKLLMDRMTRKLDEFLKGEKEKNTEKTELNEEQEKNDSEIDENEELGER